MNKEELKDEYRRNRERLLNEGWIYVPQSGFYRKNISGEWYWIGEHPKALWPARYIPAQIGPISFIWLRRFFIKSGWGIWIRSKHEPLIFHAHNTDGHAPTLDEALQIVEKSIKEN